MNGIRHPFSRDKAAGFTLAEMIVASAILGAATVATISSYVYVQRNERRQSTQSELDIDARLAVERLRRDLWRTSREQIILFPAGPGPYTAISFPLLNNLDPDAPVPVDEEGMIIWDSTVVYHFWEGARPELRVTTFSPRAALSDEERIEQLTEVSRQGAGSHTHNGRNANSRTVIRNLVDWELNVIRSRFDGYAPEPGRRNQVSLGSALLTSGPQRYTFRVTDRNPDSSGFRFGIDALSVSPTGARREAEAQFPLHSHSGGAPLVTYMPGGTWSGNYRLEYVANAIGAELTLSMPHDRWEERNFLGTGVHLEDAEIAFDTDLTPHAFVVRLPGNDKVWEANDQTGDLTGVGQEVSTMFNTAVRVLLRGNELVDGGFLNFNGKNAWIGFRSTGTDSGGTTRRLFIAGAFIAESAGPPNLMDYVAGTERHILSGGASSFLVNGRRLSDMVDITIEQNKNYVISFLVKHTEPHGYAWQWTPPLGGAPSSYVIPASSNPAHEDWLNPHWSARTDLTSSAAVFAIEYVHAGHPVEGWYTSPIFDTHVDPPNYQSFSWNAEMPSESALEMRIRSGDMADLSDAPDWDAVAALASGPPPNIQARYVQVQAKLVAGTNSQFTPLLKDFTLDWVGETRIVDIAGAFSTGPDHGIIELLVNDAPLFQGVTVDLTVYKDVRLSDGGQKRLTSSVLTEIIPRNTGK